MHRRIGITLLCLLASLTGAYGQTCVVIDAASLAQCSANLASYATISFAADVTCTAGTCCPAWSPLFLDGQSNKTILGHGHRLLRTAQQRDCPALDIRNGSNNVTVEDLIFDEGNDGGFCTVSEPCQPVIGISGNRGTVLRRVAVRYAKGIGIVVGNHQDGFVLDQAEVIAAGIMGVYIGSLWAPSRHITVTRSLFRDTNTSGLVLQGVTGTDASDNRIARNVFLNNHRYGMWDICGGVCGGGQLGLFAADHVVVEGNVIGNGWCVNCVNHVVFGVELSNDADSLLESVLLRGNILFNNHNHAIYYSGTGAASATCVLQRNIGSGNGGTIWAPGCTQSENIFVPTP